MADVIAATVPGPYASVLPDATVLACQNRRLGEDEAPFVTIALGAQAKRDVLPSARCATPAARAT